MFQKPLEQRVLRFIREHNLVPDKQRLVVAVSGGPDSVCMLYIMSELQRELGVGLHIAHLNHQLRGTESEADARYVSSLAQQLGIPATVEKRDVKSYQAEHHLSLEEAAREVRYAFLAEVAKSIGASRVAVGHTTDDHIETVLMHLIRGAGTRGLRGLKPCSRWQFSGNSLTIIRPLLPVNREETAGYCRDHQLVPRIDASNLSLSPMRNRIRLQLLPLLESYNPQVTEALLRTAQIAADEFDIIDKETGRLWPEIAHQQENAIILEKERLIELPPALKRHLLRAAIEELLGDLKDIEARHIEEIMEALTRPAGRRLTLPGGLTFSIEYNRYLLGRDPAALSPFADIATRFTLEIPGETLLPGWRVEATVMDRSVVDRMGLEDNLYIACLDLGKTGDKLLVRPRQPGDRFQPLGMSHSKKLGEFMIDAKIPHAWRQQIPVVCSPGQILWVVGWRIDERAKVTESTGQVLCLKFNRR